MTNNKPWECPRCGRINAPFNPSCFCKPEHGIDSGSSSGEPSEHWRDAINYLHGSNPIPMPDIMKRTKINLPTDRCFVCNGFHGTNVACMLLKTE